MFNVSVIARAVGLLANAQIQKDPGIIVGPISKLFGYIIDFVFNIVYAVSVNHSLGFSIIFLTVIVRCLMLPLAYKQQKSMMAMQKLNPEVDKIRKKYASSKDPEVSRKMNAEIQALYAKNKINPLSGCLPMLFTMPLFFGLNYIMNQSYMFIKKLGEVYAELAALIQSIPQYTNYVVPLATPHVPQKMLENQEINLDIIDHFSKVLNKFSATDWNTLFAQIPAEYLSPIQDVYAQKQAIEQFFGLPLIDASGWGWPGIIIPLLAVLTTFLSSYLTSLMSQSTDQQTASTQRIMMLVMPFMMGFMTISMPAGVGLYWITSSLFQVAQQLVMNKRAGIPVLKRKSNIL